MTHQQRVLVCAQTTNVRCQMALPNGEIDDRRVVLKAETHIQMLQHAIQPARQPTLTVITGGNKLICCLFRFSMQMNDSQVLIASLRFLRNSSAHFAGSKTSQSLSVMQIQRP